eukprot:1453623-Heterocapsa_arctica.AAC.1
MKVLRFSWIPSSDAGWLFAEGVPALPGSGLGMRSVIGVLAGSLCPAVALRLCNSARRVGWSPAGISGEW